MSSVQERLQLKRVPLDKWSVKEQLCLSSAVASSGDQNWMSVSRSLKMLCPSNRPSDWFSQKSCAAQYGKLLENVETPKRKKRTLSERDGATVVETPGELILRKLTQERVTELKKLIAEDQQQFQKLKEDILLVQNADEAKLRDVWAQIEAEKKLKEKERQTHATWLKEREEKKLEMERAWRPLAAIASHGIPGSPRTPLSLKIKSEDSMDIDEPSSSSSSSKPGTSPLLTSLLKSPSSAPSQSQQHPQSSAARNLAPTITNLLTSNTTSLDSQSSSSTQSQEPQIQFVTPALSANQSVSILPKSEDILEFGDLTGDSQSPADHDLNKDDDQQLMDVFNGLIPDNIDELADILTDNNAIILSPDDMLGEDAILDNVESLMADQDDDDFMAQGQEGVNSSLPKNEPAHTNATESVIKAETDVKEELKKDDSDETVATKNDEQKEDLEVNEKCLTPVDDQPSSFPELTKDNSSQEDKPPQELILDASPTGEGLKFEIKKEVLEASEKNDVIEILDDPTKDELESSVKIELSEDDDKMDIEIIEDDVVPKKEVVKSETPIIESAFDDNSQDDSEDNKTISDIASKLKEEEHKDSDIEIVKSNQSSVDQKVSSDEETYDDGKENLKDDNQSQGANEELPSISLIDTDDDSPIEVIKEERKMKRDYSRSCKAGSTESTKKSSDEPISVDEKSNLSARMKLKDRDRSESPSMDEDIDEMPRTRRRYSSTPNIDSIPNSPASSEDREFKAWKKAILLVYNRIATHKYASVFGKVEEIYPNYRTAIHRPMDLSAIRRSIESGGIKSTAEFQRDIMVMCHNLMILSSRRDTNSNYSIGKEFLTDAIAVIESTMDGWKKEEKSISKPGRGRKSSRMSNI